MITQTHRHRWLRDSWQLPRLRKPPAASIPATCSMLRAGSTMLKTVRSSRSRNRSSVFNLMPKRKKRTTTKNSRTQLHTRHKNTCKHTKFPGFVQNLHGRVQTATCAGAHWVFKRISCSIHTSFHQGLAASCRWVLLGVAAGARMFSSLLPYSPCTAQARGPQN